MCAHHACICADVRINKFILLFCAHMYLACVMYIIIRPKGAAVLCIIRMMYCIIRIIVLCIMQPCSGPAPNKYSIRL